MSCRKYDRSFRAYKANTGKDHPLASDFYARHPEMKTKRAVGVTSLTEYQSGLLYGGDITVGTPPVTYSVDFDTGSADLFLPGPGCNGDACNGHKKYYPRNSSTSVDLGQDFSDAYGDGSSVTGEVWTDAVGIGGITVSLFPHIRNRLLISHCALLCYPRRLDKLLE